MAAAGEDDKLGDGEKKDEDAVKNEGAEMADKQAT